MLFNSNYPPKIIAEISGNHGGSKKKFLEHIKSACINGADLIKIQTYEPIDIVSEKISKNFLFKKGVWKNNNLYNLYKKACTPFSWHKDAFDLAKKYNKILFSSPFSIRAVDLLESLNCQLYKIASFEITDVKLIRYIASKKKTIIMSTGMATLKEIDEAIKEIKKYHNRIIILHCVSDYPTILKDTNLKNITKLKSIYSKYQIGLSDHTSDIISSLASIPLGVVAIEKHFKINNKIKTADSKFSITPKQLKELKLYSSDLHYSLFRENLQIKKINKKLRRSIYAKSTITKNDKINLKNIETLRPKVGICASNYFKIIGKIAKVNIKKGSPIFKSDIS